MIGSLAINVLTIQYCVLLNSVQTFIEIEASLLLNFFLCLHNEIINQLINQSITF